MSENQAIHELVITRTFNAPRDLVFKMWTEAEHLEHWWGPKGLKLTVVKLDVRPDGIFHYKMSNAEGLEMWGKFVYREVDAPEKLEYVSSFSDPEGNTVSSLIAPGFPLEVRNVVTFDEHDGKTILTLRGGPINATEEELKFYESMHGSMQQGFAGTFSQLDEYLASL
ncbi:SRPBCC family protein [Paenibacillus hamazuiensis]|uniref:SRPBCC family protein n=1 Tax=Paenibacillus hamazuiensis TaxID=2936508 RepID=UPI00200CD974|nr:SRPBCC domain-containing protein [Paenibacillus hamazuiensis]